MTPILAGLRVLDFCWIGAGSLVTQTLAVHGAEVIKVESRRRPDNLRLSPPRRPGTEGLEASGYFASRNAGKKSFALNMSHPEAPGIARRLVSSCSVVTSNFRPGIMERWGLGYEQLQADRSDLIYLTMPMQGEEGPHRSYVGFGSTIAALAGLVAPSGLPGRAPVGTGTNYPDHIANPGHALVPLLGALLYRNRTGLGGRIELSQFESTVNLIGPAIIAHSVNGKEPVAAGNWLADYAPHGVYRCAGKDAWCAISVRTDVQWSALVHALDTPALEVDPRFATHEDRKAHESELDGAINTITLSFDRWELMSRLQAAGVPASAVETAADVYSDPHLAARGYWREMDHPVMGSVRVAATPHVWKGREVVPTTPAPLLGQHTRKIAAELLDMNEHEYDALVTKKVLW